ncbi:hypothetical protein, partial [Teichococcus deserti]
AAVRDHAGRPLPELRPMADAPPRPGHNGGPPLDPPEADLGWNAWNWRRAHRRAWKTPPREIALRRLARAEELGISYRDYQLEILERGRYL